MNVNVAWCVVGCLLATFCWHGMCTYECNPRGVGCLTRIQSHGFAGLAGGLGGSDEVEGAAGFEPFDVFGAHGVFAADRVDGAVGLVELNRNVDIGGDGGEA